MSDHTTPWTPESLAAGEFGTLDALLPELAALRSIVETSDWHVDSVYDQSVRLFEWVRRLPEGLLAVADVPHAPWRDLLEARPDPARGAHSVRDLLAFAALIHDTGKTQALVRQPDGGTRCPDHEAIGARLAHEICGRFVLSEVERRFVIDVVRAHGEPYAFYKTLAELPIKMRRARLAEFVGRHVGYAAPLFLLALGDLVTSQLAERRPIKYAGIVDLYRSALSALSVPLDRPALQQTLTKNAATSYGLTLAIRVPYPSEAAARIVDLQAQVEGLLPGRFSWYEPQNLHATLVAPLRGRYRSAPPLQRDELPPTASAFIEDLGDLLAARAPFRLELGGVSLVPSGIVLVREQTLVRRLAACFARYPALDRPKRTHGLHLSIGYLNTLLPFEGPAQAAAFETAMGALHDVDTGAVEVDEVWLVHYANRTLSEVIGQVALPLGRRASLSPQEVLERLGIPA